jgi:hypothetical protein
MIKHGLWKATALMLFLIAGISLAAENNTKAAPAKSGWTATTTSIGSNYSTTGQLLNGHIFGFIKKFGKCDEDILYIALSSHDKDIEKEAVGELVYFDLGVDGDFHVTPTPKEPITHVNLRGLPLKLDAYQKVSKPNEPDIYLVTFDYYVPQVFDYLKQGNKVKVAVVRPESFAGLMAVKYETFDLSGLNAARQKALKSCKAHK